MISQLFVLSGRGDTIITRDFRGDLVKGTNEIFFRKAKFWKGDPPPAFNIQGINFLHLKKGGLFIVVTTKYNVSPAFVFQMLQRFSGVVKDFCGVLTQQAIRKNFVLIYQIIDEMIDCGYPQSISTQQVRPYLVNEPIPVQSAPSIRPNFLTPNTLPHKAVYRPVATKKQKNEIFLDVFEKISILFNQSGYVVNSSIEGCIQMKSYLIGNPQLRLSLNQDLVVGRPAQNYGDMAIDDCNFHQCVNANEFNQYKILTISPPDGEFIAMNYRINSDFQPPFRIFPFLQDHQSYRIQLIIKIRSCFPKNNYGANVAVRCSLPKLTTNVNFQQPKGLSGQTTEYSPSLQFAEWRMTKFPGDSEYVLKLKISLSGPVSRQEIGPISMVFEIPMYNVSNIQVKYLRIADNSKSSPCRWVRYVTKTSSYVCRV